MRRCNVPSVVGSALILKVENKSFVLIYDRFAEGDRHMAYCAILDSISGMRSEVLLNIRNSFRDAPDRTS